MAAFGNEQPLENSAMRNEEFTCLYLPHSDVQICGNEYTMVATSASSQSDSERPYLPVLHVMDLILCEVNNTQPEYVEFQPCSLTSSSTSETLATPGRVPGCRCTRLEQCMQRNCLRHVLDQRSWPKFRGSMLGCRGGALGLGLRG